MSSYDKRIIMAYLDKCDVAVLDETISGVVNFPHVVASRGNAFTLCDDMDAPNWKQDVIPFFLLSTRVPGRLLVLVIIDIVLATP